MRTGLLSRRTFIGSFVKGAGYLALGHLFYSCKDRSKNELQRVNGQNPCISNALPVDPHITVPFTQAMPRIYESNEGFNYVPVRGASPCIRAVVDSTDRSKVYGFINIGEMDYTALIDKNGHIVGWDFDPFINEFGLGEPSVMRWLTVQERVNLKRGNSYRAVWDSLRGEISAEGLVHGGRRIIYLPPAQEIVELKASFDSYKRGLSER